MALEDLAEAVDHHTEAGRRYAFSEMLEQFRGMLLRELDYRLEAANLQTLAESLEDRAEIIVPRPVEDYTTSRVLTMELVRGTKVSELSRWLGRSIPSWTRTASSAGTRTSCSAGTSFRRSPPSPCCRRPWRQASWLSGCTVA